jgi:hypothetical protein
MFRGSSVASRIELSGELRHPALSSSDHGFAIADGQLHALDANGESIAWRRGARHAALSRGAEWLVVEVERVLSWLSPRTGEELHRIALPDDPSDPPVLSDDGVIMVPLVSGDLFLARPGGSALARIGVASGPLWRPTWNEHTHQLAVASGSGIVKSIDLRGWHGTHSPGPPPEAPPELRGERRSPRRAHPAGDVEAKLTRAPAGGA